MPLLKAWNGTFAHIEENCALPGFHVSFARSEETAQLTGLFTGSGLRGMLERKDSYVVGTGIPVTTSFTEKSLSFEECCELTRITAQCCDIVSNAPVDHKNEIWVDTKLKMLQPETEQVSHVFVSVFASHSLFGLYTLLFTSK